MAEVLGSILAATVFFAYHFNFFYSHIACNCFELPPINFGITPINVKIVFELDKNSGDCASKITRNIMSHNCIYVH